jgi:hypothetical protein
VSETTVRLEVAGKGAFQLAVDRYRGECTSSALDLSREFTITGGSGIYAGGGTVHHFAPLRDTCTGTLNVPGLEFDVTPPTLSGAVNRTVRAQAGRSACASPTGSPPAMLSTVRSRCPAGRGRAVTSTRPHLRRVLSDGHQREREGRTLLGDREARRGLDRL